MPTALENYNEWAKLAGLICVCPAGCTDTYWGNGEAPCSNLCEPCRRMSGKQYQKPPKGGKPTAGKKK